MILSVASSLAKSHGALRGRWIIEWLIATVIKFLCTFVLFLSWFMGCVTAVYFIFLILLITLPYAIWNLTLEKKLLVNDKITTSCPTNLLSVISKVANNKTDDFWKSFRLTSFEKPTFAIRFNLLQVCPSAPYCTCRVIETLAPFNCHPNI